MMPTAPKGWPEGAISLGHLGAGNYVWRSQPERSVAPVARAKSVQTTLLPPEAIECVVRIGVVGAGNHVQVQVEATDPGSGELLALWSDPHKPYGDLESSVRRACTEALQIIRELSSPF